VIVGLVIVGHVIVGLVIVGQVIVGLVIVGLVNATRIEFISSFIGPENSTIYRHEFSSYVHYFMRICFYYKNDSGLIFSHKISVKNRNALFVSNNTLKFTLSKSLKSFASFFITRDKCL
jgi:hypothetical protein